MSTSQTREILALSSSVALCMLAIVVLTINISLIKSLITHYSQLRNNKLLISTSLLTTVTFLLSVLSITTSSVIETYSILNNQPILKSTYIFIAQNSLIPYFSSQSLMICLFIIRIDKTFKGTALDVGQCRIKLSYSISIIMLLIILFISIVNIDHQDFESELIKFIEFIIVVIWVLINLIMSIVLIIVFIKRIDKIIIVGAVSHISEINDNQRYTENTDNTTTNTDDTVINKMDSNLHQILKGSKLLHVVIKHAVLVPIAIISKFISILSAAFLAQIIRENYGESSMEILTLAIDSMVNCLVIYLLFGFNDKIYFKLCSSCHRCCKKRKIRQFEKSTEMEVKKQTSHQQTTENNTEGIESI